VTGHKNRVSSGLSGKAWSEGQRQELDFVFRACWSVHILRTRRRTLGWALLGGTTFGSMFSYSVLSDSAFPSRSFSQE
jgi:hypothetical protein